MKRTIQLEDESYQIRFTGLVRGTCPVGVSFWKVTELNQTAYKFMPNNASAHKAESWLTS